MCCSPHHTCKSQRKPGRGLAQEQVERRTEVKQRETCWADCVGEAKLNMAEDVLSSRGSKGERKEAEK